MDPFFPPLRSPRFLRSFPLRSLASFVSLVSHPSAPESLRARFERFGEEASPTFPIRFAMTERAINKLPRTRKHVRAILETFRPACVQRRVRQACVFRRSGLRRRQRGAAARRSLSLRDGVAWDGVAATSAHASHSPCAGQRAHTAFPSSSMTPAR